MPRRADTWDEESIKCLYESTTFNLKAYPFQWKPKLWKFRNILFNPKPLLINKDFPVTTENHFAEAYSVSTCPLSSGFSLPPASSVPTPLKLAGINYAINTVSKQKTEIFSNKFIHNFNKIPLTKHLKYTSQWAHHYTHTKTHREEYIKHICIIYLSIYLIQSPHNNQVWWVLVLIL